MNTIRGQLIDSIPEVMRRFDFNKTKKVMDFLDWKWLNETPSLEDLKCTAFDLLVGAVNEFAAQSYPITGMTCATGGFVAEITVYGNGSRYELSLYFYVHRVSDTVVVPNNA